MGGLVLGHQLLVKIEKITSDLGRILSNLFGSGYQTRKLYANVLNSIVMYGAPVWAKYIGKKEIAATNLSKASAGL